jgi:glucose-1-phosphate thymidylyltransferase
MRAIIPVAGVGTRLRPHTYTLPKVLLNVAGKPILGHILDSLLEQDIKKATIVTGYMGRLVQDYVTSNYDMEIDFVSQRESLGLGHAIWTARETFKSEPLIIILGDTIFDMDLSHIIHSDFSSIGVKKVDDPRRFGVVELDEGGFIKRFVEKPDHFISDLAIVGIYYIANSELLKSALSEIIDNNIRTRDEFQLTDALEIMHKRGENFRTVPIEGWYDCGKPETLLATNRFLLDRYTQPPSPPEAVVIPPVFIANNAVIERSVIGPYATVANGAIVKDSIIRNSIISDEAYVESTLLENSIIGNQALVRGHFYRLNVGNSSEVDFRGFKD